MLTELPYPPATDAPDSPFPLAFGARGLAADRPTPRHGAAMVDTLLTYLPVGVVLADAAGTIVHRNPAALALRLRYRGTEGGAALTEAVQTAVARTLLLEEPVHETTVALVAAGHRRRWIDLRASLVRAPGGRVEGVVVTLDDVTARRERDDWAPMVEMLERL